MPSTVASASSLSNASSTASCSSLPSLPTAPFSPGTDSPDLVILSAGAQGCSSRTRHTVFPRLPCNGMLRWGLSTVRRLGGHDSALCSPRYALLSNVASHIKYSSLSRLLTSAGHSLQRTDRSTYSSEATRHVTYERAPGVDVQHKRFEIPVPLQASGNSVVSVNDDGDAASADDVHDSRGRSVDQPRYPRRPSSLDILHIFLSPQNLSSPTPQIHTANTLRALYRSLRPEDLSKLSSQRLTDLISIFGTLSADDPPSSHTSALAAHMDKRSFRTWWKVVLQLVRDKKNAGKKMLPSDYYWLVRARTSGLTRIEIDALEDCEHRTAISLAHCT